MRIYYRLAIILSLVCAFSSAQARDDIQDYSITEALSTEKAKEVLGTDVKFYFGEQRHAPIAKKYGQFNTNKKTNGVNKSDKAACEWAFLSAMKSLKERANREGGNAVVNIRSNYRDNKTSSTETFKCGSGKIMSGVALIGDVVSL